MSWRGLGWRLGSGSGRGRLRWLFLLLLLLLLYFLLRWCFLLDHCNDKVTFLQVVLTGLLLVGAKYLTVGDEFERVRGQLVIGFDLLFDLPDSGLWLNVDWQLLTIQRFDY